MGPCIDEYTPCSTTLGVAKYPVLKVPILSDWAIEAKGLVRTFGDVEAVKGIDLSIPKGEIYGFLGPNGAGKTTLVRMLITLLLPTKGQARVSGFDLVSEPKQIRLRIGAALQEATLDPKQTGLEFLRLQGYLYGLSRG